MPSTLMFALQKSLLPPFRHLLNSSSQSTVPGVVINWSAVCCQMNTVAEHRVAIACGT